MIQEIAWYLMVFLCFASMGMILARWGEKNIHGTYGWGSILASLLVLILIAIIAGKFGAI